MSTPSDTPEKDALRSKLHEASRMLEDAGRDPLTDDQVDALVERLSESVAVRAGKHLRRVADHLNLSLP